MHSNPTYLNERQLIKRWNGNVTLQTVRNWRQKRTGPAFSKFGGRVLYELADIEAFENSARHATAESSEVE